MGSKRVYLQAQKKRRGGAQMYKRNNKESIIRAREAKFAKERAAKRNENSDTDNSVSTDVIVCYGKTPRSSTSQDRLQCDVESAVGGSSGRPSTSVTAGRRRRWDCIDILQEVTDHLAPTRERRTARALNTPLLSDRKHPRGRISITSYISYECERALNSKMGRRPGRSAKARVAIRNKNSDTNNLCEPKFNIKEENMDSDNCGTDPLSEIKAEIKEEQADCDKSDNDQLDESTIVVKEEEEQVDCDKSDNNQLDESTIVVKDENEANE